MFVGGERQLNVGFDADRAKLPANLLGCPEAIGLVLDGHWRIDGRRFLARQ